MQISLLAYLVGLALLIVITTGIIFRALFEWQRPGSRTLSFLMLAVTIWEIFYLLEIVLPTLPQKIMARELLYIGMSLSPPIWLGFTLRYSGFFKWWQKKGRSSLLTIPGLIVLFLGFTNQNRHLIWVSMKMPKGGSLGGLELTYGNVFWLYTLFGYLCVISGIAIYARSITAKKSHIVTDILVVGAIMAVILNIAYLTGKFPSNLDPTPIMFSILAPILAFGYFKYGFLNLIPIAAPIILEHLRDGIIVVDRENSIINLNQAGNAWLGIDRHSAISRDIFQVIPEQTLIREQWNAQDTQLTMTDKRNGANAWYEITITQLFNNARSFLGRLIVIHDITKEHELLNSEFRKSSQMGLLEEVGRLIANSFQEKEIMQNTIDAVVNRFGYAEAAISILEGEMLEVTAIGGVQDFGYQVGFKQEIGMGIIGHTAEIQKTYIAENVASDPFYFSTDRREGSAIGIPIPDEKGLLGVLYVENDTRKAFTSDEVITLETLVNQVSASIQRARLYARAQENLRILSTVQSISHVVSTTLDLAKVFESVVNVLSDTYGYPHVSIYFLEGEYLHLGAQTGYPEEMVIPNIHISQGITGRTFQTKTAQFIHNVNEEPDFLRAENHVSSEICVPLLKENEILGILNVEGDNNSPLTNADFDLLITLAGPVAIAMDNARLHEQIKAMAMTDAVTGLSNRHSFEDRLETEIIRAKRFGEPLSLIIFDIDSFKNYNDQWGHPAGDTRLKATADLIRNNLRKNDIAARYGGDEFAIILPKTNKKGALVFCRRLHAAAQTSAPFPQIADKETAGYTLSIGVATFPENGDTMTALLLAADNAELTAKRLGKNQIYPSTN